jgi:hypothetical protein
MKRSLWLIFAALALIAAAVSFRLQPEALTQAAPVIERLPDVRVQHEYVTVPVSATGDNLKVKERSRLAQTRTMPDPLSATPTLDAETVKAEPVAIRKPAASRASNRAPGDETLFAKARRAFMGDGRHRPEPFPRPRGNN